MTLIDRIKRLRLGQTFIVQTETERQKATQIALAQGRLVSTRKRKRGGFTVTRLPE